MCSRIIITTKASANTNTFAAEVPVDITNPICTYTKCDYRNIITFPGGNLCEYYNDNHKT
ncbi:hypothetical protein NW754_013443 [Fusarium falciforme]|uniref:Uncharacterized protein n=1 Tax=Fusarium falciforme TaxID=195108 RepID=A0A9W8QX31_9HYPO|nr:hypothetical protein NW754_013443 [Fusarium falciforme]KAJ4179395.1 hypothetical protein NW755_012480 [Fusarium falciforme]KAJ4257628.1 hypothetical protein NW757_003252 [Fusarium falciforme]